MSLLNFVLFLVSICLIWTRSFSQEFFYDSEYSPKYNADRVLHYFDIGETLSFTRSLILDPNETDYKIKLKSMLAGARSNELYEGAAALGKNYPDTVRSLSDIKISSNTSIYEFLHTIELYFNQDFLYQELYDIGKICDYMNRIENNSSEQLDHILQNYNSEKLIFEGFKTFNPDKWVQRLNHLNTLYSPELLPIDFDILVKQRTQQILEQRETHCGQDIPFNIKLLQLYQYIAKAERERFILAAAAYQVKHECNQSGDNSILSDLAYKMVLRTQNYMKTVKKSIKDAPREIRLCNLLENDDSKYIETDKFHRMSLKEAVSDVDENEIITAIAFGSKNDFIYPRIQTAKLSSNGYVREKKDPYKFDWEEFDGKLQNSSSDSEYIDFGGGRSKIQTINLDDIYLDSRYVVTGVKFVVIPKNEVQNLAGGGTGITIGLQVRATEFDFATGKLGESRWVSPKTPVTEREELKLINLDNPFNMSRSLPDSLDGQYLKFRNVYSSTYKRNLIVPFFDKRSRTIFNTYPLGGVGLYHNGATGSAGYISFKLISYDPSEFMRDDSSFGFIRGGRSRPQVLQVV